MTKKRRAARQRLDQILVERGLAPTRAKAQALVLAGTVFSGETRLDKPGTSYPHDTPIEVRESGPRWVSRGAGKLIAGLDAFGVDPAGATALDVGASTGGFTEVLLARSAAKVYAVDVGYGQLDLKLRGDPRVVVMERTNARRLTRADVPEAIDLVVCDASFISLKTVLPAALDLTAPKARLVALIKPQFEAGRGEVGKGGVVRDVSVHERVQAEIRAWLNERPGWRVLGTVPSPVIGPKGNHEFLIGAVK